jgi:sigma-B regulation protein RsbU (phosphoserine phosphatase)
VGGDYFDVRQISPELFACVIVDVSGKGVSAALLAALLQGAFVFASEAAVQIDDVMSRVNRFLYERARGEKYATVVYCTVNLGGEVRWANAGHPHPLLVRMNGEIQQLESTGMPIGMMDVAAYGMKTVQLEPGDKMVLFSDGVSEAANEQGECFDKRRLAEVLKAGAKASCSELHAKLIQAVEEFSDGDEQADDITIVVLEYRP